MNKLSLATLVCFLFSSTLIAQTAPDFTITGTDNNVHRLYADYLDQGKTVVLKIMFVSCPPCNSIAPATEVLYQEWGGGQNDVEFFDLSDKTWDSNADVLGYENTHNLTFPGAGEDGGSIPITNVYKSGNYGQFFGTPTFVVIAPDRTVTFDPRGPSQTATLVAVDLAIAATGAVKPSSTFTIQGNVQKENGEGIMDVSVDLGGNMNSNSNDSGQFFFQDISSIGDGEVVPAKDNNHDNGVNILDIILMQKHILFIEVLDSPYKKIAADLNKSGKITVGDIIQMRRLILFIDEVISNNTSWRFVDVNYVFPPANHSDVDPFPESVNLSEAGSAQVDFVAVKTGDLNNSAEPSLTDPIAEDRSNQDLILTVSNQGFAPDQKLNVPIYATDIENLYGLQFTLEFDNKVLDFQNISSGLLEINGEENIGLQFENDGIINFMWADHEGMKNISDEALFYLEFHAIEAGNLEESFHLSSKKTKSLALGQDFEEYIFLNPFLQFESNNFEKTNHSIFNISPNPATESFQLHNKYLSENYFIRILDLNGNVLSSQKLSKAHMHSVNISNLQPGIFFVDVMENGCSKSTLKIIKIR